MNQHEQLTHLCEQVQEIAARTRRTETNLHKIREHLGLELDSQVSARDSGTVISTGHDVTLSQIKRALEKREWFEQGDRVSVVVNGATIAVISFHK